jgi:hypothetical protein
MELGKALCEALETGVHADHIVNKRQNISSSLRVPTILVPRYLSPWPALPMWNGLITDEDFVQQFRSRSPDAVVFDENFIREAPLFNIKIANFYFLATLFCLFSEILL